MLKALRAILGGWLNAGAPQTASTVTETRAVLEPAAEDDYPMHGPEPGLVPYDENLLERARTQWQFGDWESLAKLERDTLQHHPDRAKLALLVAAGQLQCGNANIGRQFVRLAEDWGCARKLISQILIAGVHNSIGRACAVAGQQMRSCEHFESAITLGAPGSEKRLLTQARAQQQTAQIGLDANGRLLESRRHSLTSQKSEREQVATIARQCIESPDIHASVDALVSSSRLRPNDLVRFYVELAEYFTSIKDNLSALHFLESAKECTHEADEEVKSFLVRKMIALGKIGLASEVATREILVNNLNLNIPAREKVVIFEAIEKNKKSAQKIKEHGHDLLLTWLQANLERVRQGITDRQAVLIEIGTTRENVPGQGSTRKIADFCKMEKLQFITVDMDPHNVHAAEQLFESMDVTFQAISAKGEDFLREYAGPVDFIFLDAYDFDHGKHSELRQSRYMKYLGNPISDAQCHLMHLECARSIIQKLTPGGVVCLDDTWMDNGKWTAKGTLAMPFLLENGFRVIEAHNRAALLERVSGLAEQPGHVESIQHS